MQPPLKILGSLYLKNFSCKCGKHELSLWFRKRATVLWWSPLLLTNVATNIDCQEMFSSGQLELCRYHHKLFPSRYVLYAWQIIHLAFNVIDVVGAKLLPCQPCFCLVFLTQITVTKNTKLLICYSISSDMESDTSLQYVLKHSGLKWDCPSGQLSGGYLNSSCSVQS